MKIGIIGCGKQAPKHISGFQAVGIHDLILFDVVVEAAKKLSSQYGCSYVENLDELFADPELVAVDICTPVQFHRELIERAIGSNLHFFCEKPLSNSLKDDVWIEKTSREAGVIGMVGYIYRFVPTLVTGKEILRGADEPGANSEVLGNIHTAIFRVGGRGSHTPWKHRKETGGGALNEMAVHMIDLAHWYFGPMTDSNLMQYELRQEKRVINGTPFDCDAEDWLVASLTSQSGVKILIIADLVTPAFVQSVQIQGSNGSFCGSIDPGTDNYLYLLEAKENYCAGKTKLENTNSNFFVDQMGEFVNAVTNNKQPDRCRLDESVANMRLHNNILNQI